MSENYELITWNDNFSCGITSIDDQHKVLVDLVNDLFNHVTGNYIQERDYFNRVIHEVIKYVKNHFAMEEKILSAAKFPGYAEQKKEHDNFIRVLVSHVHDYQSGKRITLSSFTKFFRDWVLSHIALMDKLQYYPCGKTSIY